MCDVDAMSRCVYKKFCYPFCIRSSRGLVFNIESDNNMGDPPEHTAAIRKNACDITSHLGPFALSTHGYFV